MCVHRVVPLLVVVVVRSPSAVCLPSAASAAVEFDRSTLKMSSSLAKLPTQTAHVAYIKTLYRKVIKLQLHWIIDRSVMTHDEVKRGQTMRVSSVCLLRVFVCFIRSSSY